MKRKIKSEKKKKKKENILGLASLQPTNPMLRSWPIYSCFWNSGADRWAQPGGLPSPIAHWFPANRVTALGAPLVCLP
jgi:hypothetical protein